MKFSAEPCGRPGYQEEMRPISRCLRKGRRNRTLHFPTKTESSRMQAIPIEWHCNVFQEYKLKELAH
jgi:hypothetical protein